jgi:hypothetical protein
MYTYFDKLSRLTKLSDFKEKGSRPQKDYQDSFHWPAKATLPVALAGQ